jgi:DNA repair ATPase RecN
MATQRAAANQAAIKERWKEGQDFQKYKTSLANFETNVKNAQRDRDDYDTQISEIDKKIADINNLTNLSIPKEERPAAVEALRQQRETISSARSSADRDVKEQETALQDLQKSGKLFDNKESKTSSDKKDVNIPSKEDVKTILDAINTNPDKLDVIKANFNRLHPGVPFEKYVKVNPQSKAFTKK